MISGALKRILVMLDLDQTLISSELLDKSAADDGEQVYNIEENKVKARNFNFQNMEGLYVIFERPHLQEFLTFLFENFDVGVWTAASQDYANFIVKHIVIGDHPERKLKYFLCNYHGKKSSSIYSGSKDLKMLWELYKIPGRDSSNTIILDDYIEVYNTQKNNCVAVKEFCYFNNKSEEDDLLPKIMELLKENVLNFNDKDVDGSGKSSFHVSNTVKLINSKLS